MRKGRLIQTLTTVAVFLVLETVALVMIAKGGIAQRYRIVGAAGRVNYTFWRWGSNINAFFDYRKENERLASENLALRNALGSAPAAPAAGVRPASPVSRQGGRYTYSLARVIRNSTGSQKNFLVLDKGSEDGVQIGNGVVTKDGVVGVVSAVDRRYSRVESFLNTSQRVSARISPCGAFGILHWNGRSLRKALLSEIPRHTETAPGDTVLTSGYSAIYPPDIPLGVVRSIKEDGVSLEMEVELFQNFNTLRHVYIVSDRDARALKELSYEK